MPASPQFRRAIVSFAIGACAMYYAWAMSLVPGDFQGDSREYVDLAASIKDGSFDLGDYDSLRGVFYPWFLSATGGSFWTYSIQAALFLAALVLALRAVALDSVYGLLPILAAMIPAVAFLQRQLYPDGMLVSLTLLFFAAIARRRWLACAFLGVILAATKLIFAVTLPITLAVYILDTKAIRPAVVVRATLVALALIPLLVALAFYVFIGSGYMVIYARPYSHGYAADHLFPPEGLEVRCGGAEHHVPKSEVFLDPITVPHRALWGPLAEDQAARLGCGPGDLRSLMWQMIKSGFAAAPALHIRLAAQHFSTALIGGYAVDHLSHILRLREGSWSAHYDQRAYLEPNEIQLLATEYREKGFEISAGGRSPIFVLHEFSGRIGESIIRWAALALLALSLILAQRRGALAQLCRDPVNIAIVSFLVVYSGCIAVLGPSVYDRYTYLNLLCICFLAARLAAQTFPFATPEPPTDRPTG